MFKIKLLRALVGGHVLGIVENSVVHWQEILRDREIVNRAFKSLGHSYLDRLSNTGRVVKSRLQ
jgi:hypothetical protein